MRRYKENDNAPLVQNWVSGAVVNNGVALALTTAAGAVAFDSKEATLTSHQPELEIVLTSTSGGGGVTSFNGRTGAVVPAVGDYSFSLLSGALGSSQLSGTYSSALTLANAASVMDGTFAGNGAALTNVNAATLGGSHRVASFRTRPVSRPARVSILMGLEP